MLCKILFCVFVTTSGVLSSKSYEGHKVFNVSPKTVDDVNIIKDLEASGVGVLWEDIVEENREVKFMVSSEKLDEFLASLKKTNINAREVIEDVQRLINRQLTPPSGASRTDSLLSMRWDRYHSLEQINSWLDELAETYPNIVTTVIMGVSVENREIKGVRVNFNPDRNNKLIGMLEGALHAREWISPATVTWILKEFLISTDPEVRALADNFEWHIFPVVNPDGYSYTFTHNRMWRKNRSPASFKSCSTANDDMSNGVDLNRNFDFHWMSVGASNDSCSNLYAGPIPFSEPEARAIAQYVLGLKNEGEVIYYIAFHSYTQLFVVPYSNVPGSDALTANNYGDMLLLCDRNREDSLSHLDKPLHEDSTTKPKSKPFTRTLTQIADRCFMCEPIHKTTHEHLSAIWSTAWFFFIYLKGHQQYEIAIRGAHKLSERFGTQYRVGVSAEVMYMMSGTSFDWVKYEADVPVTYLLELRDLGEYGFLLPPEQIIPNNLEIMDALLEMDKTTRSLGYYYSSATSVMLSVGMTAFGVIFIILMN